MTYAIFDKYSGEQIGPSHDKLEEAVYEANCRKLTQQGFIGHWGERKPQVIYIIAENYEIKEVE